MTPSQRFPGLDLFRAAAISMVLAANTIFFFQLQFPAASALAPIVGFLGLEAFFVLSGFLMACGLYPLFVSPDFTWKASARYVGRRLWRIVPLYSVVVLLNIGMAAAMDYPTTHAWKYFLLVQNFSAPIPAFFPESWGLPVIVFAAMFFAFLLSGLSRIIPQRYRSLAFGGAALLLLLIFLWTKVVHFQVKPAADIAQWETTLRTVVLYRIDSVMVGVLTGWLFLKRPTILRQWRWALFAFGVLGMAWLGAGIGFFQLSIERFPMFWHVIYLPMTSLILACLLPALVFLTRLPNGLRFNTWLSAMAFSIYLTHFSLVLLPLEYGLMRDAVIGNNLLVLAAAYVILSVAVGWLFHTLVESVFERFQR